jgi:protein SCO1
MSGLFQLCHPERERGIRDDGSRLAPSVRDSSLSTQLGMTIVAVALFATAAHADTSTTPPQLPGKVAIAQKLGNQIPLDVMMRDETGAVVRLRDYFTHGRPVILHFVYYKCPMLCPLVLDGLTNALTELKFNIGDEFDIITISMDPRDKASEAAQFKDRYVKRYGRLSAANGWHFLTANESAIRRVADSVGFEFAYDGVRDQFAHGAAIFVLTPTARLSRYFYGFEFKPRDLRLAIVEASGGKIGTATDQILLLCYHYDPVTGRYSRATMDLMRAGGVTTVAALGSFIFLMIRKERRGRNA